MARQRTVFTYDDYRRLPDDGRRWEVLDGCLVHEPAPRPLHQVVISNILWLLESAVRQNNLGMVLTAPLDVVLSEENVVQPDIVFIPSDRLGIIGEENVRGAPALVIEVLSPSTLRRDRAVKRGIYERFGVREYWVVDPGHRRIERLVLAEQGYGDPAVLSAGDVLASPLFPGLAADVHQVFDSPLTYR